MEKLNISYLINDAKEKLKGKDATRMAAIHVGVIMAVGLTLTVVQMMLSESMESATGLSGLGTISLLQTVQTVLNYANILLVPFWNLGFLYVALQWARNRYAAPRELLTGFRRIGPCIGLMLNRFLIYFLVVFLCATLISNAYLLTPAGIELQERMLAAGSLENYYAAMDALSQQELMALVEPIQPVLILCFVVSAVLLAVILYRFRLAEFVILDQPGVRALPAMIISASLLRRRCWQLFKLDLRLWWYYGLKLVCIAVCYGDTLLNLTGVQLPVDGDVLFIVAYLVYLVMLFGVETRFRPQVDTAYACVYADLKEAGPVPRKTAIANPQKLPWDET